MTLHLYKQNLKFSSAHFLIFNEFEAERLHGHNYQVQADLQFAEDEIQRERGYSVDFKDVKVALKALVDEWDEYILLPAKHKDIKVKDHGKDGLELKFRERLYVFPKNEVVLLPITNTSVENLALLLAEKLFLRLEKFNPLRIRIKVAETSGQAASQVWPRI